MKSERARRGAGGSGALGAGLKYTSRPEVGGARAVEAGATTVTVCESTGSMLPEEFAAFVTDLAKSVPALSGVVLGVSVSDGLAMAAAYTLAARRAGWKKPPCSRQGWLRRFAEQAESADQGAILRNR